MTGFVYDDLLEGDVENEDLDVDLVVEEEEDDDDNDELDDPTMGAGAYFATQRRTPRVLKSKRKLSELSGGQPEKLSAAVHKLLMEPSALNAICNRFAPHYPEWLSFLHSGFSLLL